MTSEPDIKAPLFNITHYDEGTISPGYWFIDPYDGLGTRRSKTLASLFQVGAHMYDNRGELVWSGAAVFENRNSFDFKVIQINGTSHLSLILAENGERDMDLRGAGIIMDSQYTVQQKVHMPDSSNFNMHEFNVIEDGHSALVITWVPKWQSLEPQQDTARYAWVANSGFQEIDLRTNKVIFDWNSLDHIDVSTSRSLTAGGATSQQAWDWIHINSIDKDANGDYLVSARHTSTIYKVSGRDGSIIWQLGGNNSSFVHEDGFNFSFQHDARFRENNSTHTIISFLDNASNGQEAFATANISSVLYTDLRGSVQELPNSNIFVCWSDNGYISEFTSSGELALEAKFMSERFVVYRAYKFNFTGLPLYPPAVKAYAFGTTTETITTVFYVSWNGATEVTEWQFHGNGIGEPEFHLIGSTKKEGFETMYMSAGYQKYVYVEALDVQGISLGRSEVVETIVPSGLEFAGCSEGLCQIPEVKTPLLGYTTNKENQGDQDGSVSTSKESGSVYSLRNIILAFGGLVIVSLFFALRWWLRSRNFMANTKYEQVQSDESSLDEHALDKSRLDDA
ncbi:hypothetical protein B7463_g2515, partial [Scytalidium lignicola]